MVFCKGQQAVANTSAENAEVAGIRLKGHPGKPVDQGIERFLKKGKDLPFAAAILIGGYNVIFRLLIQNSHHVPGNFRALL